jgi:hypothetical protein
LSGDPIIQDPTNGQNYDRYSYVFNNPTNFTDPTGFLCDGGMDSGQPCKGMSLSPQNFNDASTSASKAWQKEDAAARANASSGKPVNANNTRAADGKNQGGQNSANNGYADAKAAPATDGSAVGQVDIQQVFVQGFRQEAAAVADNHRGVWGWNWLANAIDNNIPRPDNSAESKIATVFVLGAGISRGRVKAPQLKYAPRVRARGVEDPVSHNFPYSFDAEILSKTPIHRPNDYKIYQAPGSMAGSVSTDIETGVRTQLYKDGVFEIGVNKDGVIDHRFFRPNK